MTEKATAAYLGDTCAVCRGRFQIGETVLASPIDDEAIHLECCEQYEIAEPGEGVLCDEGEA